MDVGMVGSVNCGHPNLLASHPQGRFNGSRVDATHIVIENDAPKHLQLKELQIEKVSPTYSALMMTFEHDSTQAYLSSL
jgi:hypothetical protein